MKKLAWLVLVVLGSCQPVAADGIYTGMWSWHTPAYKQEAASHGNVINGNHHLIAVETDGWILGEYENSFSVESQLFAKRFPLLTASHWQLSVIGGAVHGYYYCEGEAWNNKEKKTCPAAIPELRYTRFKLQPAVMVFAGGVAVALRWEL